MELLRNGLKLVAVQGLDDSEGSVNVPVKLVHNSDDQYINFTEQVHIRYINSEKAFEEILPSKDSGFYIPGKVFVESGPIQLAVHLINGDVERVTNELQFVVKKAPNGKTLVDPSEFSWQQLVDQYVSAKLETFADKADMNEFKNGINANLTNQDKKITDLQNSTKTYVNVNGLSISEIIDKYNEGAIPYIPNNITFSGEKLKSVKRFAGDGILITHQYIKNDGVKERGGIFTPSMYDNNFARDVNFFSEKESAIKLGHQKTGWLWGGENLFTDTSRPLLVPWGQVMKNPDCDLTENVKIYIGNLRVVAHHTNGTFSCIFNDPFDGCMLLPIYESSPDELIYKSLGYENGFRTIELTPTELENFCLHFYTGKVSQTYYINRPDDCDWIAYKFSIFSDTIENTLLFNGGCDIKTNDGSDTKEIGGTRTLFVKNTPRDICFTNCPVDNLYYKVIDDIFENVVVSKRISVLDTKFNSVNERYIFNGFNVSDTSTSTFKFAVTKNKAYLLTVCEVGNGIPSTDNSRAYILFIGDALKAIQIGGATDKFYISTSYSNNVVTITVPTKYCIVSLTKL